MSQRHVTLAAAMVALAMLGGGALAQTPNQAAETALATNLADMARTAAMRSGIDGDAGREVLALFDAACRLAPGDARLQLHRSEVATRQGRTDAAIESLVAYRRIEPQDRVAQARLIDLYLSRIQTAEARQEYINQILGQPSVHAEVQSHAAYRGAALALDRGQDTKADALLSRAVDLNPYNVDALSLRLLRMPPDSSAEDRAAAVLSLVRANSADPAAATELALLLADAGLVRESVQWFKVASDLTIQTAGIIPRDLVVASASQMVVAGLTEDASQQAGMLLTADPLDPDAVILRVLCAKAVSADSGAALDEAAEALRAGAVRAGTPSPDAATTRPAAVRTADLSALARQTVTAADPDQGSRLAAALADLAFFHQHFQPDPARADEAVAAVSLLLRPDHPLLARLNGWNYLQKNQPAEARSKLSAVADRDPLAELGLIQLLLNEDPASSEAKDRATQLLNAQPSGLVGAIIWESVRQTGVRRTLPESSERILAQLAAVPPDLLNLLSEPGRYYSVGCDPIKPAFSYAEPMLAKVTLTNTGPIPLTVGDRGVIHPDLWVDAQIRGVREQPFPGASYDRFVHKSVLKPGESINQVVRVDGGALTEAMLAAPAPPLQVFLKLQTNPIQSGDGVVPGVAGQRISVQRVFSRMGFAISNEQAWQRLVELSQKGLPAERLGAVTLMGAVVSNPLPFGQAPEAADEASPQPATGSTALMQQGLSAARESDLPALSAWAGYVGANVAPAEERSRLLGQLAGSDYWPARLLAAAASVQGAASDTDLLARLADDSDQAVKDLARSMQAASPATSIPATAPVAP